ncbi:MAG: acetyl-CoA C-acyltransferase FadI [Longimicrobiales bacterium]|nr:acetyl-CoA C-acyltransferase FadI [Longimicrobiales bacterium]
MKTVIVAGVRTPFARSGTVFRKFKAVDLGRMAVRELVARSGVDPASVDELIYGTVVHDPHAGNIAREVGLTTLPKTVPATTVSRACATSNQAIVSGANLIEVGYADVVIAGGAESLSHIPILVSDRLSETLVQASKARTLGARLSALKRLRPRDLLPKQPEIAEPTTGETMGESAERMAKANGITRTAQDEWALRSHSLAAQGTDDGRLTAEMVRTWLPPDFEEVVEADNGIRTDTSLEKLAALRPVFDRQNGSVTAGNASPLTDGASAVLLMSEERARADGFEILGRIRSYGISALDPGEQLLQGPAFAAPVALDRAGVTMRDIGLMEMHEAFASQVLSNLQWLDSDAFAREKLGRTNRVGHPDVDRINVMGGSIAIGHPFAATGARITTTLLNEMKRRDVELGMLTVCAAGGLGFAMVLERV